MNGLLIQTVQVHLGSKFPYITSEINKQLGIQTNQTSGLYRVIKTWQDAKSKKGAFKNLDNAKRCADMHQCYVFDDKGIILYPVMTKLIEAIAREVINGKWGNGQDRKNRLTQAGYDYHTVQNKVNELLK